MFCLYLQYQGAGTTGTAQFGAQQFGLDLGAFERAVGSDMANTGEQSFLSPFHC